MFAVAVLALFAMTTTSAETKPSRPTSLQPDNAKAKNLDQKPSPKSGQKNEQKSEQKPDHKGRNKQEPHRPGHPKPHAKAENKAPPPPLENAPVWTTESRRIFLAILGICVLMSIGAGGITFLVKDVSECAIPKDDEVPLTAEHRYE
jgi:hypothetical protein